MDNPVIDDYGNTHWYANGVRHREDGPSYVGANGTEIWRIHGEIHRIDGPAVTYINKKQSWYVNGNEYTSDKEFQKAANISDEDMAVMIMKYGNVS